MCFYKYQSTLLSSNGSKRVNTHFVFCTFDLGNVLHSLLWQKQFHHPQRLKACSFAQHLGS